MKYIILFAMLLMAVLGGSRNASADPIRNPDNGHYYELRLEKGLTWYGAVEKAAALPIYKGKRPQLVTYGSFNEELFVVRRFGSRVNFCWIGLYRRDQNSGDSERWAWIDGTPYSHRNWHKGTHHNGGRHNEWFGIYWFDGSTIPTAGWTDISNGYPAEGYIVEYK